MNRRRFLKYAAATATAVGASALGLDYMLTQPETILSQTTTAHVTIDGESVWNYHIGNVDYQFNRLMKQGKILGDCVDQSGVVDSFLKACGIATTFVQKWQLPSDAHMQVLYYDQTTGGIRGVVFQLNNVGLSKGTAPNFAIYFPPIRERGYLDLFTLNSTGLVWFDAGFSNPKDMTSLQVYQELLGTGVPIQLMKKMDVQWESIQAS